MAKLDNIPSKAKKAKKRKNIDEENPDEIPNKTLLLSHKSKPPETEKDASSSIAKRKSNSFDISPATKKLRKQGNKIECTNTSNTQNTSDDNDGGGGGDEDGNDDNMTTIRQPTYYELLESEKPENTLNIITVRKKKKQKHQVNVEKNEEKTLQKEIDKNHLYLSNWKNNRNEWKFEKLRQISIQNSIFDENKISNDIWSIALEYLSGTKGISKDNLIKFAEKQISELDNEIEMTKNKEILKDTKYKRARELLQILQ